MLRKHANTPNWPELSLPHVHLLLKQVGEYTDWTNKISTWNTLNEMFGGKKDEGEAVNEEGSLPTLEQIEEFQSFAKGAD